MLRSEGLAQATTVEDFLRNAEKRGDLRNAVVSCDEAGLKSNRVPKFTEEANHWLEFGRTGGYLHHCKRRLDEFQREHEDILAEDPSLERTHEYGYYRSH